MKTWFVAQTQMRREAVAAFHLQRQGFQVYLPQYLKLRRHARKRDWVSAPLFPRYLFVALDLERDRWRAVRSTVGVSNIICRGDSPAPVPNDLIRDIRERENENGTVIMSKFRRFRAGEKIQVLMGAFAECFGIFDSATDTDRVRILLDLLGRMVSVELPLEAIEATS